MTKQQQIGKLEKELQEAYKTIEELNKAVDEGFHASNEYKRMQEEIKTLRLTEKLAKQHRELEIRSDKRLKEEIRQLRDDNMELCAEHGKEYWEGMTDRWDVKEMRELESKIVDLEAKVAAKDVIIEHYKDLLGGRDPLAPKEKVMGRRPIPEEQKKRIRKYRRDGYTLKEISGMEGVSIGAVSNLCKGLFKKKT